MCDPGLNRLFYFLWLVIGVLMVLLAAAAYRVVKLWKSR